VVVRMIVIGVTPVAGMLGEARKRNAAETERWSSAIREAGIKAH
jgi:hypothetical protein